MIVQVYKDTSLADIVRMTTILIENTIEVQDYDKNLLVRKDKYRIEICFDPQVGLDEKSAIVLKLAQDHPYYEFLLSQNNIPVIVTHSDTPDSVQKEFIRQFIEFTLPM